MTEPMRDEQATPEILTSEQSFDGHIWDVRRERFAYNGDELVREFVDHPGAAAVVALDEEDRVLLIQQYRHPIRHRDWEIPAGLLDVDGEAPMMAARRELGEEADLRAERWEPLISVFTTPGGSDEVVHIFLARGLSPTHEVFDRGEEEADMRREWVAISDIEEGILAGRLRNNILISGVLAAAALRRRERASR